MRAVTPVTINSGLSATLLGFGCAGGWALLIAIVYFTNVGGAAALPMTLAFLAAALGPIVLILFSALSARDAARANSNVERVMAITETAAIAPSAEMIEDTRELAATLRTEIEALDTVVHIAAKRLDAFESGLRQDGGVMARALAADIETMGRVREDLNAQTIAVGDAIARHVEALRETSAQVAQENIASASAMEAQIDAFGAISARIGARSAEFAAAAAQSSGAAGLLDTAVDKALTALAHATSLTQTARKSAEQAASVAQEAAGAVRGATRNAVAEARDATRRLRAEAEPLIPALMSGPPKAENFTPPAPAPAPTPKLKTAKIIEMKRPAKAPAPAPESPRDLPGIVAASGVVLSDSLNPFALERIAQAAASGPASRRQAVRTAAPQTLRKISAYLRRDALARREAENLRREPGRALGAETDSAARRQDLASAYLLVDAVLG